MGADSGSSVRCPGSGGGFWVDIAIRIRCRGEREGHLTYPGALTLTLDPSLGSLVLPHLWRAKPAVSLGSIVPTRNPRQDRSRPQMGRR